MNKIEGPWCYLGMCGSDLTWRIANEGRRPFACDDFWRYFDWECPEYGQEMRLVFLTRYIKGAQETLVRNDEYGRQFIISPYTSLGLHNSLDTLLGKLDSRFEFYVWWWPEYREGVK